MQARESFSEVGREPLEFRGKGLLGQLWNARAAVVRCSGPRVLRTSSHAKASFTAAIVVRSVLAAERSSWVVGVLVGWIADRLAVCWPVSWDVVVAVDTEVACLHRECSEALGHRREQKNPLAGDGFRVLGSPISNWGDHGAPCRQEPESGGENPGRTAGFYQAEGWGREGYTIGR